MYEYRLERVSLTKTHRVGEVLSLLGQEGWRAIHVVQNGADLCVLMDRKIEAPMSPPKEPYPSTTAGPTSVTPTAETKKGRGRPKGSKNKSTSAEA